MPKTTRLRPAPSNTESLTRYIEQRNRQSVWTKQQRLEYYAAFVMARDPMSLKTIVGITGADYHAARQVPGQKEELEFLEAWAFELLYAVLEVVVDRRQAEAAAAKAKRVSNASAQTAEA